MMVKLISMIFHYIVGGSKGSWPIDRVAIEYVGRCYK